MVVHLMDFAVITIFAREFLEGSIILGEYRTILQRGGTGVLEPGVTVEQANRVLWTSAWVATAAALLVIAAIAIPLSVLSRNFDDSTSKLIEGVSKMVAGICLLQLSLKLPKFLGVYGSTKNSNNNNNSASSHQASASPKMQHEDTESIATDNETRTANVTEHGGTTLRLGAATDAVDISNNNNNNHNDNNENEDNNNTATAQLSLRNMRFNVAWNIWREGRYLFLLTHCFKRFTSL